MKKKLVLAAALILAVAALVVLLVFLKRSDAAPDSAETAYVLNASDKPERIAVRNAQGEFAVLPAADSAGTASIEGLEDCAFDSYALSVLINHAEKLESKGIMAEGADIDAAPFGLAAPRARVEIRGRTRDGEDSGETVVLLVGGDAPDGENAYVMREGGNAVHLAAARDAEDFLKAALDFVDKRIIPSAAGGSVLFSRMTLGGAARGGQPVVIVGEKPAEEAEGTKGLSTASYRLVSPANAPLSPDGGLDVLRSVFGLRATRVAARIDRNAPKSLLARYGLAEPYAALAAEGAPEAVLDGSFSLRASKPDESGSAYVFREGGSLIYEASASALPWLDAPFFSFMDKFVVQPAIGDVAEVEVRTPGRTVAFRLSGDGDALMVSGGIRGAGERAIDAAVFRAYYQNLLAAKYDAVYDGSLPRGAVPSLEIVYRYRAERVPDRVAFYPAGGATSRRLLVALNGGRPFYAYSAYADALLADTEAVLRGETVAPYR